MVHRRLPSDYAEDATEFGRRVREHREARGWSQDKVIELSDHAINKKTLQRIEQGHSGGEAQSPANPELRVLIELCKVLGGRVIIDMSRPYAFTIEFDAAHDPATDPS